MTQNLLGFAGGRSAAPTLMVDAVDLLRADSLVIDGFGAPEGAPEAGALAAVCDALRVANESTKMEALQ
jgi:hypothetical protein